MIEEHRKLGGDRWVVVREGHDTDGRHARKQARQATLCVIGHRENVARTSQQLEKLVIGRAAGLRVQQRHIKAAKKRCKVVVCLSRQVGEPVSIEHIKPVVEDRICVLERPRPARAQQETATQEQVNIRIASLQEHARRCALYALVKAQLDTRHESLHRWPVGMQVRRVAGHACGSVKVRERAYDKERVPGSFAGYQGR